ncbi:MAG: cyclomaltodextrinase N-terminal domain-containing protein [Sphingobacteriales bacterium]|nr:cyclomaltodextrinase N-terminal domain-containing protein [Sphingobacteriales bacterium]
MKRIFFVAFILLSTRLFAIDMYGIYPSHWWVGMKNPNLQLMIHRDRVANEKVSMLPYPGVKLVKQTKVENENYLFIDLLIDKTAKPGKLRFMIDNLQSPEAVPYKIFEYELKTRSNQNGKTRVQGVTSKDFIYLMMPDRFSNGDASNDIVDDYRDRTSDRKDKFSRHGGDFKGILNHFDYFNQLGVTTLWLTPVLENDMPRTGEWGNSVAGYHGYWFTNHYEIDKRFGGNEGYKEFCNTLHQNGMKVIQDAVYNHVGDHHWFVLDPPMKSWFNTSQGNRGPNHREEVFYDPYASQKDKENMLDGWFVPHLPDLNQRNPFVANFLIQHAIWTTEEYGIDGWRVDTYKYCDEQFMNNCNAALAKEFPKLTVFGETWVNSTVANAYFTQNKMETVFKHNAKGMLDFQVCFAMLAGMNEPFGWLTGVNKIYTTLSQDVLYKEPLNNCIFLDNHDMDRVFSVVDEDWNKMKMGFNWLLTLRGIPQIYYGTEVLMKNKKENTDATVREDFPGGWPDDKPKDNRFTKEGRNDKQDEAFEYISRLANFRRNSSALTSGKTMQYIPKEGLYVYFRYDAKQIVMVVTNTGDKNVKPDWNWYRERTAGSSQVRNVITGKIKPLDGLEIEPKESFVFELLK